MQDLERRFTKQLMTTGKQSKTSLESDQRLEPEPKCPEPSERHPLLTQSADEPPSEARNSKYKEKNRLE